MEEVVGRAHSCSGDRMSLFHTQNVFVLKSPGLLTCCLAAQGILSSCLSAFGHKQEGKDDSMKWIQGDLGTL